MDRSLLDETTQILTEFAGTKFSVQVPEVRGPLPEGSSYRWSIVSDRFREVTVVFGPKKPLFGKPARLGFVVYGLGETTVMEPDLKELQSFLDKADLTAVG